MIELNHPSLKAELLYLIGRSTAPMNSLELYEKSRMADDITKVAKALGNLQGDGKILRVEGEGRARYRLAPGIVAPAPAGKSGRSKAVQADDATPPKRDGAAVMPTADYAVKPDAATPGPDAQPAGNLPLTAAEEEAVAKALDQVEQRAEPAARSPKSERGASSLADAILARLKHDLGPLLRPGLSADVDVTTAPAAITVNVDRVEIHISIGVSA